MRKVALVTGSSEGLGKSFALELASRGMDVVLVSLKKSGLPELAAFIKKNYAVRVDYFEMDLTCIANCSLLFACIKEMGITVRILINNAGIGNWSWFEEKSLGFYKTQIELNILTPVLLTRLFLEQVDADERAYLLNVGSLGGLFIVPKKQVYGATKSFIRYFTQCLRLELAGSNVSVSLLSPGGINTKPELLVLNHNLKGISKTSVLEPEQVAKRAVDGMLNGKKEIIPGITNKCAVILAKLFPGALKDYIIKRQVLAGR